MKKTMRILILVLSLALVFGMIAVVANAADDTSVELTQAMVDEATDGVINFTGNMHVASVISVSKDLTLNLNGYTLNVDKSVYFNFTASATLNVNGAGTINCGLFVQNNSTENTANVNLRGNNKFGLVINQNGTNVTFVANVKGNVNVDNVTYFSDSPYYASDCNNVVVFDRNKSAEEVNFNLTNSSFRCDTASDPNSLPLPYIDNKGTEDTSDDALVTSHQKLFNNNTFIEAGQKGTVNIDGCNVDFAGSIINMANVGKNRTDTVVTVNNSVLDAYTPYNSRTTVYYGGQGYNCSGWVKTTNSKVGSTYGLVMHGWNTGASPADKFNLTFENCVISNYGVNGSKNASGISNGAITYSSTDETTSPISGNPDVYLKDCVYLSINSGLVSRQGNAFVTVGTRSNRQLEDTFTLYYSADTTIDEMVAGTATTLTTYTGDGSSSRMTSTASGIKWVYDPVTNPSAPWVAVPADAEETSTWLAGNMYSTIQNYEETKFVLKNEAFLKNPTDFLVYESVDGKLKTSASTIAGVGGNGWNTGLPGDWHKAGNWQLVKTTENNYIKWYAAASSSKDGETVNLKEGDGSTPCLFLSNESNKAITPAQGVQVIVYEISLSSETNYPDGDFYVHVRHSSQSEYARLTIKDNKLKIKHGYKAENNFPAEGVDISEGWNHLSVVMYFDLNANKAAGTGSGMQYVYLNGELIATAAGICGSTTAAYGTYGFRYDIAGAKGDGVVPVGTSFCYDNMSTRYWNTLPAGETFATAAGGDGKYNPAAYVTHAAAATANKTPNLPVARVGGVTYYDINDAIAAQKNTDFDIVLLNDFTDVIDTDEVFRVYDNGYTFDPVDGYVSVFDDYNFDYEADGYYTVDASKKFPYAFYNGEEYVVEYFFVGEVPTYPMSTIYKVNKKGQQLFKAGQTGWVDTVTELAPAMITGGDYISVVDENGNLYSEDYLFENGLMYTADPVYSESEITDKTIIVVDKNGNYKSGINNLKPYGGNPDNSNSIYGLNASYGDTIIFNADMQPMGSIKINMQFSVDLSKFPEYAEYDYEDLKDVPAEDRWFAVDLNGHNLTGDFTEGGADIPTLFVVEPGDSFSLYSSVPGAEINLRGGQGKDSSAAANGGWVVAYGNEIKKSPSNLATANASNVEYMTELYANLQAGYVEGFGATINIGTATDYAGATHPGANMTVYCDGLLKLGFGDATHVANIDGLQIYKTAFKQSVIRFEGYNGTVNLTNTDIVGGAKSSENDYLFYGNEDAKYFKEGVYRAMANANVDNVSFYSNHGGQWLIVGEGVMGRVHFQNFESNCAVLGTRADIHAIWIGDNVVSKVFTDGTDPQNRTQHYVDFDEGINYGIVNYEFEGFTYKYQTVTHYINDKDPGNNRYNFELKEATKEGSTTTWASTSKALVNVSVTGTNGNTVTKKYVNGGNVLATDFTNLGQVNGSTYSITSAGTFNGGIAFPVVANEDITYVVDTVVKNTTKGYLQNLSLFADLTFNAYIPAAYAEYITNVTVNGVAVDLTKRAVIDEVEYIQIQVKKNITEIADNIVIVVNYTENNVASAKTFNVSVLKYVNAIKAGEFSTEEKALMDYILNYAYEANTYFEKDATVADPEVAGFEKNYNAIAEADKALLAKVFKEVTITLAGEAPAYQFTVADDFNGTITVNGKEMTVTAGEVIVIDTLRAYNFLDGVTVTVGEETATFAFENYAAQAKEEVKALVDAIYDYCYAAEAFMAAKNA